MRILLVHNFYQLPGGEDHMILAEHELLARNGHRVEIFSVSNEEIVGLPAKLKTAWHAVYSRSSRRLLSAKISEFRPDLVHVHNFFPLLTPSIYDACIDAGVPVVQILHNYRILCPGARFVRNSRVCEDCMTGSPYRAAIYGCYRNSRMGTLAVARMVAHHRREKTWQNKVDCFIALTEFARRKFIEGGLPAHKIAVKPNFIYPDPGCKSISENGKYALFVGRLSPEKGLKTLLEAWNILKSIPLKIVGGGPLKAEIEGIIKEIEFRDVDIIGHCSHEHVLTLMKEASFLIFPSEGYETFGLVAIEAFACGIPVIASQIGALGEIVEDGENGLHFTPGDPVDLAAKVKNLWNNPELRREMGKNARRIFEDNYTAEKNYELLMEIYHKALGE